MANSESTFADKLGRAQNLQSAVAGYTPAFAPADVSLKPPAFKTFIESIETANETLDDKRGTYSVYTGERLAMVKDIKARAQRAMSYIKSNSAWAKRYESAKLIYDKLRGYTPANVKAPEGDTVTEKKKVKVGQQSFSDIEGLFSKLITALGKVPRYAPPAAELTIAELTGLDDAFSAMSDDIGTVAAEISVLVRERAALYEELSDKAQSIKAAVSSQYGPKSAEFTTIKGLKF